MIHHPLELPDDLKRKICGTAADLEARPTIYGDLVQNPSNLNGDLGELKFPKNCFQSKNGARDIEQRLSTARRTMISTFFLVMGTSDSSETLCVGSASIERPTSPSTRKTGSKTSVDAPHQTNCLIPESDLDTWKQTHLEFGSQVIPKNEEVELYRSLGEAPLVVESRRSEAMAPESHRRRSLMGDPNPSEHRCPPHGSKQTWFDGSPNRASLCESPNESKQDETGREGVGTSQPDVDRQAKTHGRRSRSALHEQ